MRLEEIRKKWLKRADTYEEAAKKAEENFNDNTMERYWAISDTLRTCEEEIGRLLD